MKNIIWQMPSGALAVYNLLPDADSMSEAAALKSADKVAADWLAVAYDVEVLPSQPQQSWRFVGGAVVSVSAHMPAPTTIQQIRAIEARPEVIDALTRLTRQKAIEECLEEACAKLPKEAAHAKLMAEDKYYAVLVNADAEIAGLRGAA